jgi:myosin heavy subunit
MCLANVIGAMRTLLFREAEIETIWRLLAAILHLGNLRYIGE